MRRHNFPHRPRADDARMRIPELPQRKVFKCIVDDTALMLGVKKSTRDGIRKWVSQGAINLYVPLHTLMQLDRMKKGSDRTSADAREAIKWLDEITSMPAVEASGCVRLEGGDETYETWKEVELFLLPKPLLSMEDTDSEEEEEEELADELESSFAQLDVSDETSMSSSHSLEETPKTPQSLVSAFSIGRTAKSGGAPVNPKAAALMIESPNRTARNSTEIARIEKTPKSVVPDSLKPLFNHILWLVHKESNPDTALESFILLTNEEIKQQIAHEFGIRAKRLEQLREAVGREDREFKNRLMVYKMESEEPKARTVVEVTNTRKKSPSRPKSIHSKDEVDSEDEDVVLLKRAPRGPQSQAAQNQRIFDPNDFGRTTNQPGGRGGRGSSGPRGRGTSARGRGSFSPRGAYTPPAPPFRAPPTPRTDPNQPIDPDSFARPNPRVVSTRGSRRKLWEPN